MMFPKLLGIKNTHRYFPQLMVNNPYLSPEQIIDGRDLDLFGLTLEEKNQLDNNLPEDSMARKIFSRFSGKTLLSSSNQTRFELSMEEVFILPL